VILFSVGRRRNTQRDDLHPHRRRRCFSVVSVHSQREVSASSRMPLHPWSDHQAQSSLSPITVSQESTLHVPLSDLTRHPVRLW